ncbi:MAG TPA: hypothetical protein DD444_24080 [Citreicella sp.]|nr:hypothetical protein [Citreicella sp.]HBT03121.1 hypothetical protein [Citreicella sp.]|tara:strand:- start:665 stop:877 length:213 start_codon:yes stop_codon:yes gene_type:complete
MCTVAEITRRVPQDEICERLGVQPRSIRLARERRLFPASWFKEMSKLCEELGVECPDSLFNFKMRDTAQK